MDDGRIFIEDVKCGYTNQDTDPSGDTCFRMVSVRFRQYGKSRWLHHLAMDASIYWLSDEDLHDRLLNGSYVEENLEYIDSLEIRELDGFPLPIDGLTYSMSVINRRSILFLKQFLKQKE